MKVNPSKVIRGHFHLKCFLLTIVIYFCLVVLAWCRIASSSSSSSPPPSSSPLPSSSSLSISSYSSSILLLPRLTTPSLSSLTLQSSSLSTPESPSPFLTTPLTSPPLSSSSSSPSSSSSLFPISPSSPPTSTASIENPTSIDNNGTLHFQHHHHHHHHQQLQHLRRRHHHRHHHFLRRRRHRRGQTTSSSRLCEEVNICVPLAFLIMLYLVYLVESWHCRLRFELRNATTTRDVYRSVDDASSCRRPQVTWKASGYHYSRKTDYVIKNRGGHMSKRGCYFYYERINTFKRSVTFDYTSLPPPLPHHHHHHQCHHHHHHRHHDHHHHDQHCGGCYNDCLVCRRNDDVDSMIEGGDDDDDDRDSLKTKESFLSSDEELHHLPAKTCHDIFNCQTVQSDIKTDTETKSEISPTSRNNNFNKPKPSPVDCVLDRSENLIGLDDFPATRIIISKGFEFDSCYVQREYERQKMDFYEMCRQLDDFLEFEEHLELPGSDVKGSYFAVRTNHHHNHNQLHRFNPFRNRRNWFKTPPISSLAFWLSTFLFLSWPYRLAVELNTASVDLKIRKLFTSNCRCHGNGSTPNKIQQHGFVAADDDRKSRRHEAGSKRPHLVHHPHHPPVNTTYSTTAKCPTTPTKTPHKQKELTSATNPFYRRPPNFSKTESSKSSPSYHRSPQMFVKYRDGNISSEIKSQPNYKTMQQSPTSRPVSKLAANGISHAYSKAKNNFFSDSTR